MSDSQHPPVNDDPEHLADLLMVDAFFHGGMVATLQRIDGHVNMANHCQRSALVLRKLSAQCRADAARIAELEEKIEELDGYVFELQESDPDTAELERTNHSLRTQLTAEREKVKELEVKCERLHKEVCEQMDKQWDITP